MFKHDSLNESNLKYAEKLTEEDKDDVEAILIADIKGCIPQVKNNKYFDSIEKVQNESNLE